MLQKKSVDQILEVLAHAQRIHRAGTAVNRAYQEAVDRVRRSYNVAYQTIGDLCCRRQGLEGIHLFIDMLEDWLVMGNPERLIELLLRNSDPAYRNEVTQFFSDQKQGIAIRVPAEKSIIEEYENFSVRLHKECAKKLKVLTLMNDLSVQEKLTGFLEKKIEEEYTAWLRSQVK